MSEASICNNCGSKLLSTGDCSNPDCNDLLYIIQNLQTGTKITYGQLEYVITSRDFELGTGDVEYVMFCEGTGESMKIHWSRLYEDELVALRINGIDVLSLANNSLSKDPYGE